MFAKPPVLALALAALLCTPFAHAAAPAPSADFDRAMAPIHTRAELDAYLARNRGSNPFDALAPVARAHFIANLHFGSKGLASLKLDELASELSAAEAYRVLALFGLQTALAAVPTLKVVSDDDRAVDAWRAGVVVPDYFTLGGMCTGRSWSCEPIFGGLCWVPCEIE